MKSGDLTVLPRPGNGLSNEKNDYASANIALVMYTDNLEKKADKMKTIGVEYKGIDGGE